MAGAQVIDDTVATVVALTRAAVPATLIAAMAIRAVTRDELARIDLAMSPGIGILLVRASVSHRLRQSPGEEAMPLELSLLITPWADEAELAAQLLGHILVGVLRAPLPLPPLRQGTSWHATDTLQLVEAGDDESRLLAMHRTLQLPLRPCVSLKAQVFSLDAQTRATPAASAND